MPLERAFAGVEETPVAAASLGQAHRHGFCLPMPPRRVSRRVVLKVQRPGIGAIVDVDLAALRKVGGWLSRFSAR